jgi:Reverse transcriptase (RNA-dependent DNA polymerase)
LGINVEEGTEPLSKPAYRLSLAELDELKTQLTLLLKQGLIRPSTSPWAAQVLFTTKKEGSLRMCLDYRALNKKTVKNKCPLSRIDEIFDHLEGAKHFTTLDLRNGHYQIRVKEEAVPKTCIRTRYGSFEFLVMPFGLTTAPSVFQALMNDVFWEFLDDFVMVYLDDIIIYSKSEEEHLQHVETALQKLKNHALFGKLSNYHFNETEVDFLDHVMNADGINMQKSKVEAIQKWLRPKNVRDLQSFLRLANCYRRYITNSRH